MIAFDPMLDLVSRLPSESACRWVLIQELTHDLGLPNCRPLYRIIHRAVAAGFMIATRKESGHRYNRWRPGERDAGLKTMRAIALDKRTAAAAQSAAEAYLKARGE